MSIFIGAEVCEARVAADDHRLYAPVRSGTMGQCAVAELLSTSGNRQGP